MISTLFHTFFYNPIYNALITIVSFVPGGDVGLAVVVLTIIIRVILLPLSLAAIKTQRRLKEVEPKIKEIKELHKDNREKQALETLALYKSENIRPFASILTTFIQIPVLLALFFVFSTEALPALDTDILYSFTPIPGSTSILFLGLLAVSGKSILLATLAGVTQFLQAHFSLLGTTKPTGTGMQADFQRVMGMQLRYVFPFLIIAVSYSTSGAVALYFITTNIIGVLQEHYVRRSATIQNQSQSE